MSVEFDLDALQAQVDRSMAFTNNLVTSWLPPSLRSGKAPGNSEREAERALQELIKRPPRLGVGAALPESENVNSRETARLKNKLAGKEMKTKEAKGTSGPKINGSKPQGSESDEDDEDEPRKGSSSRGSTNMKGKGLARLDPFSKPTKKMKKPKLNNDGGTTDVGAAGEKAPILQRDNTQGMNDTASSSKTPKPSTHDVRTRSDRVVTLSNTVDKVVLAPSDKEGSRTSVETPNSLRDTPATKTISMPEPNKTAMKADKAKTPSSPITDGVIERATQNESLPVEDAKGEGSDGKEEQHSDGWEGFSDSGEEEPPKAKSDISESPKDINEKILLISVPETDDGRPLLNLCGPPRDTVGELQKSSKSKKKKRRRNKNRNKNNGCTNSS